METSEAESEEDTNDGGEESFNLKMDFLHSSTHPNRIFSGVKEAEKIFVMTLIQLRERNLYKS